jgi:hypothetical protein
LPKERNLTMMEKGFAKRQRLSDVVKCFYQEIKV